MPPQKSSMEVKHMADMSHSGDAVFLRKLTSESEAEDYTGETKGKTSQIIPQRDFETVDA